MTDPGLIWQPSLFSVEEPSFDRDFEGVRRIELDADCWVDHGPSWVASPDGLFDEIVQSVSWQQRSRRMYDRKVLEPRLTAGWTLESGEPLRPAILEEMRLVFNERYGVEFDSAGFNLYRDGRDSVAWHGDHIDKEIDRPVVVLVSLGHPRRFLLRPKEGGPSTAFKLGRGDLLVTGGMTQRTWDHSVPKVANAGPRVSIAFRHGMDPRVYAHKTIESST